MAAASIIMTGISMAMSVAGGIVQAEQAKKAGKAQEKLYEEQAKAAEQQAATAAAQEREKYRRLEASQRAAYGASGVAVGYGSPVDVLNDTKEEGEDSAMQILYSGDLEAWNARQKGKLARMEAKNQATNAILGGLAGGMAKGASLAGSFGGGSSGGGSSRAASGPVTYQKYDPFGTDR